MSFGIHAKLDGFNYDLLPAFCNSNMSIFVGVSNSNRLSTMATVHAALGDTCPLVWRFIDLDKESGGKWPAMKPNTPPLTAAGIWFSDIVALGAKNYPYVYYQALNEPKSDMTWLTAFDKERIRLCKQAGLRCTVGTFAMGNPEPADWDAYRPVLEAANEAGPGVVLVALHVYWPDALNPTNQGSAYLFRDEALVGKLAQWGLTNIEIVYTEFGANTKGYRKASGMTNALYIEALRTADGFTPAVRKAVYDCSNIPDDRTGTADFSIQEPFGPRNGQTRAVDGVIALMRIQKPVSIKSKPPTPPVVIPPALVNLLVNPSFEGDYNFAPDDRLGDRKIPNGWHIGWNSQQAEPHAEIDADPPHVKDGHVSWRLWADSRFNAWGYQAVPTIAGATYELKFLAVGRRLDPALPGPTATLGIDPDGGIDFQAATVKKFPQSTKDAWVEPEVTFVASGTQTTVFVEARTGEDGRGDVWIDFVQMVKVKDAPVTPPPLPEPPDPPPTQPMPPALQQAVVVKTADGLPNLRALPSKSATLLYAGYPVGRTVTLTGKKSNGYVEVFAPRIVDEKDPAVMDTAWILPGFLKPIP